MFYRVRSFSFPGSTPVCGVFFFQNERERIITHVRPGNKKAPHTGVDHGKLNERTQSLTLTGHGDCVNLAVAWCLHAGSYVIT